MVLGLEKLRFSAPWRALAKFARRRSTFGERTNRRIGNIVMNIRFMINTNDFITVRYYYSLM
jgi:hypothetical protein